MTDPYMPDVVVEIAFDSGYTTPDASRTWTDVSNYVELDQSAVIGFGRQDELSTADANRLTLTLDNSDGRFTAGLTHLPNRVQDPSMTGAVGSWAPLGSPGFTITASGDAPGETNGKSLRVTGDGTTKTTQEPRFPVAPGEQYRVQAYGWVGSTAAGTGTLLAAIWFFDSAGAFISSTGPSWSPTDASAGWIQREATATVPAGAVSAAVTVRIFNTVTAGIFLLDAVKVQQVNPYYPNVKVGRPIRVTATPPKNILTGVAPIALGTVTLTAGVSFDGDTWHRVQPGAASNGVRYNAVLTDLVDGETYTGSVEIANDTGTAQQVTADWTDLGSNSVTLQPGERRRIYATGTRADYTSTFRFLDAVAANGANFLVRAPMLTAGSAQVEYFEGGGVASRRFVGFIDQWPVEWDGTDAYAKTTITATSRLSRLGLSNKMRSMPEQQIEQLTPAAYWPLGDPSGATQAADALGGAPLPAGGSGAAVVFGNATGPGVDGLTAATFAAGQYLVDDERVIEPGTLAAAFKVDALPASGQASILTIAIGSADQGLGLEIDTAGLLESPFTTGPSVNDGATHHAAITWEAVDVGAGDWWLAEKLYLDGVEVDSALVDIASLDSLFDGRPRIGQNFTGVVAHAAIFDQVLTPTEIADLSDAVLTGFAGERTDERAARLLEWAGVAAAEINMATGSETMTYQQTAGQSVVDALREVESTEGGVLFDGRDGRVTFHNRSHRYTAPVAVTFDMEAQQVESDYAPKLDRSTLTNDVTVENPTTGETARSVDTASADEYGTVTSSAKSVADSYDPLQQKAAWLVASYAEPRPRVPSLTVDLLAQVGGTPSAETILALTVGSRIKVTNQPAQADATDADYFVEGYSEAIGPESYRITFNLSPAHPSLSVFVLADATRGELDSAYVLAL